MKGMAQIDPLLAQELRRQIDARLHMETALVELEEIQEVFESLDIESSAKVNSEQQIHLIRNRILYNKNKKKELMIIIVVLDVSCDLLLEI